MPARPGRAREASSRRPSLRDSLALSLAALLLALPALSACRHASPPAPALQPGPQPSSEIDWLKERSMLAAAPALSETVAGNGSQWQQPYGLARPEGFLELASVWFNAYPASLITRSGQSFLQGLGDPLLLEELEQVGVQAIHTGPVKRAGSVRGTSYRPTIDGHFDRIQLAVDPAFCTEVQYQETARTAHARGIAIIGDIIPGHTGMGPDFRLAEQGVPGYPALYAMSEIRREDWGLLPAVPDGEDSANLSRATALLLKQKGYILGPLDAVIFKRPGIKESNWSATGIVRGSFQELNASLDKIASTLATGPELAYDFVTRPAYLYALASGDAGPLRLMLRQLLASGVSPGRMAHALQNHDELMLEESQLRVHGERVFEYEGERAKGEALYQRIHERARELTTGARGPYNESFAMSPGVCSTLAGFTAASLGIRDVRDLQPEQVARIRDRHLAAAAYNALQPGAFVVSGWDLVGALPVPRDSVRELLADNDCRWLNRGAYDLAGADPSAPASASGLPRAVALYGTLREQLADPMSFASRLRDMLALRKRLDMARGNLVAVPEVEAPGLVLMLLDLPPVAPSATTRRALVAVNFGQHAARQALSADTLGPAPTVVFSSGGGSLPRSPAAVDGRVVLELAAAESQVLLSER